MRPRTADGGGGGVMPAGVALEVTDFEHRAIATVHAQLVAPARGRTALITVDGRR